jgi:hypothetical protein
LCGCWQNSMRQGFLEANAVAKSAPLPREVRA